MSTARWRWGPGWATARRACASAITSSPARSANRVRQPDLEPEPRPATPSTAAPAETAAVYRRVPPRRQQPDHLRQTKQCRRSPTENVGNARSTGFALSGEHRWLTGGCRCCGSWLGLGYDGVFLTDAQDTELGTRLANAPRTDNTLRAFYEMPDLRAEVRWRMLGSRYLDRENLTLAPAYSTLDLTLNKQVGDGEWRLAALNVLDEKDGRFGPEPGRELRVEYTLHW